MNHGHGASPPPRTRLIRDFSVDSDPKDEALPAALQSKVQNSNRSEVSPNSNDQSVPPSDTREGPRSAGVFSSIGEISYYEPPTAEARSQYSQQTQQTQNTIATQPSRKLMDFFGAETIQMVLHNPTTVHQMKKFAQLRFCGENLEFLEQVCRLSILTAAR